MQQIRYAHTPFSLPQNLSECLPQRLRDAVLPFGNGIEELRLHADRYTTVVCKGKMRSTDVILSAQETSDILLAMCAGSLYSHSQTINQGYLTLAGGIRVGICGSAATEGESVIGVRHVTGLTVRIPHAPRVDCAELAEHFLKSVYPFGMLIYSPPRIGKTTLLRALALHLSSTLSHRPLRTVAVDTREELYPMLTSPTADLDVLIGYPHEVGIEIAVRTLGAELIVCDEIGNERDARAILGAANCGVPLIATVHATDAEEILRRPALRILHEAHVFGSYVGLSRDGERSFRFRCTDWKELCAHEGSVIQA